MYLIGTKPSGEPFFLTLENISLPMVGMGLSGSGKSISVKALIEELALDGIPSIVVDSQGDLAYFAQLGDPEKAKKMNVDMEKYRSYSEKVVTKVYTPCSLIGEPISFSPIQEIPNGEPEEVLLAIDTVVSNLLALTDYKGATDDYKQARMVLHSIIETIVEKGHRYPESIKELIILIEQYARATGMINDKGKFPAFINKLINRLWDLNIGQNSLLFDGKPFSIEKMMEKEDGKTKINVIYMNTLTNEKQVQFVGCSILTAIYRYMIANPQKSDKIRLALFVDEAAKFFPASPRNPPTKEPIKRLMKESRKYRFLIIIASQNYTDMDYKGMTQAGVYLIGRLTNKNDWEHLKNILEPHGFDQEKLAKTPPGTMYVIDTSQNKPGTFVKIRWLYSSHGTPIPPNEIPSMFNISKKRIKEIQESKLLITRCRVCFSEIKDKDYVQEYKKYLCPKCSRWWAKGELVEIKG